VAKANSLKERQIEYWQGAIEDGRKYMKVRHKTWRRLLKTYELDFDVPGLDEDKIVKISRMYPLARQIIASVSFNYPHVFFKVEEPGRDFAAEILERVANATLEQMDAKREVQQVIFDALFCSVGWLKFGYNPPGDEDIVAPYTINDAQENDFPYVHRVSPFNIYVDPLTPPHKLSGARYIIEKMIVPLEFVKEDDRFKNRRQIKAMSDEDQADSFIYDMQDSDHSDEYNAVQHAKQGQMVCLYEIHDRLHKKRITFAEGLDEPIEEVDHPFLAMKPITETDPFTGQEMMTGEFEPAGGYLMDGGFPYHAMRFDQTERSFYGEPPMAYVEDTQSLIVESVSRRADLLKRFQRVVLASKRERESNQDIGDTLENGRDGEIIWVEDPNTSMREMNFGNPPPDQLGLESDAQSYEEQSLNVSQMAMGGGPKVTATQASLSASFAQVNREWMQLRVADAYRSIVRNSLRMMADERYLPDNFLVNVAQDTEDPVFEAVTADLLRIRYKIEIQAGSMQPLTEQLERQDALQLFNMTINLPEINRIEAIKGLLASFRVQDPDKYLGNAEDGDAVKAAQLENVAYLINGGDPGVTPFEDHQLHIQYHQQIQQLPQFQQLLPQQQQQVMGVVQNHVQQHQQMLNQMAQGQAPQAAGGTNAGVAEGNIVSLVKSQAQEVSQAVQNAPGQG
jgi:hypothetical protein